MKKIILSCKKATFLISLREERKLSLPQRLQLQAHLGVCRFCKLFAHQTHLINISAKHSHEHTNALLSDERKNKITKKLNAAIESGDS
ncbi:MAG: hypothetical protein V4725_02330 [Bacteroidota bacterium]